MVQFGDKTYGLPYDAAPMVMYYRKDMLDKAGVEVPKTWEEFEAGRHGSSRQWHLTPTWPASTRTKYRHTAALAWQAGAKWFGTSTRTAGRSA